MRTKTLLLTAAVSAAGIATSMAQVFSVNAVGYVNVTVGPGFQMIANPLDAADNTVAALLPSPPQGTTLYKFNSASGDYSSTSFVFGNWSDPNMTLEPGEGAFINNVSGAELTLTFVGEVPQGDLSNPVPAGFSIRSSMVPQAGAIESDLGYSPTQGDTIYKFVGGEYQSATFAFGNWNPAEPVIEIGESVFVKAAAAGSWDRSFSVNNQ